MIFIYQIILKKFFKKPLFIIGPEGGFSDDEIKIVYKNPFIKRVKIHNRILKGRNCCSISSFMYKNYLQLS